MCFKYYFHFKYSIRKTYRKFKQKYEGSYSTYVATSPKKGENKMLIKEHQVSVIVHLFPFCILSFLSIFTLHKY